MRRASFIFLLLTPVALRADLARVKAEPNLEKRSQLALDNAEGALKKARAVYNDGRNDEVSKLLAEVQESVELAIASLNATGKDPRRSPKWFKRAEIDLRDLVKKLDAFEIEMSVDDRGLVKPLETRLHEIHDKLLESIMEGKRK